MPRNPRQTIAPLPFTVKGLSENNWRELVCRMSNRVTVLRYLTSKLVFTAEVFTQVDAVTLFCAFEDVMQKLERDRGFAAKYGPEIFMFRSVFQQLDFLSDIEPSVRYKKLESLFNGYQGKMFSRRYYYAVEGQAQRLYETYVRQRFPKTFPAKTYIGKGYGDHGTAKDKAFDGTPSWQEVAGDSDYQTANSSTEKSADYWRQFQVHQGQLLRDDKDLRLRRRQSSRDL